MVIQSFKKDSAQNRDLLGKRQGAPVRRNWHDHWRCVFVTGTIPLQGLTAKNVES
jgi:hypothetical protein